jgi:phosphocarrier protein
VSQDASQESPVEAKFTVQSELGLHARPAGRFVSLAGRFESEISVAREDDEEWVSGRSVLSILSLAASRGTTLRLRAEGPDAQEAIDALGALLTEREAESA